jgi:hypothetical protein
MLAAPRYRGLDGQEVRADMKEVHLKVLRLLPNCNGSKAECATSLAGISRALHCAGQAGQETRDE